MDRDDDHRTTRPVRRVLGAPLDLRRPTRARLRERWWNADDPRVLVPKVWGWGWDVNLRALPARVGRARGRHGARRGGRRSGRR